MTRWKGLGHSDQRRVRREGTRVSDDNRDRITTYRTQVRIEKNQRKGPQTQGLKQERLPCGRLLPVQKGFLLSRDEPRSLTFVLKSEVCVDGNSYSWSDWVREQKTQPRQFDGTRFYDSPQFSNKRSDGRTLKQEND